MQTLVGDNPASREKCNIDRTSKLAEVTCFPNGDSYFGCRQMMGNCWEWTQSTFLPFPGYTMDFPYRYSLFLSFGRELNQHREQSAPWFGTRKVVRGGSWMSSQLYVRNTYRNFFAPSTRFMCIGFRTCKLEG